MNPGWVGPLRSHPRSSPLMEGSRRGRTINSDFNSSDEEMLGGYGTMELDREGEDKMRRKLRFYFMNPLEKWRTKRQFPYKLTIQLVKIFLVTLQLILFASYRYANVSYGWDSKVSFSHLLLKDWDPGRELTTYPPTMGPLAVYTQDKFFDSIDFALNSFRDVPRASVGPYFHVNSTAEAELCIDRYVDGVIDESNATFVFSRETEHLCLTFTIQDGDFSSRELFKSRNFSISFPALLEANLFFKLKTVRFRELAPLNVPDCFLFDINISFNNRGHDGQILLSLEALPTRFSCKGDVKHSDDNKLERIGRSVVNYLVIGMCSLSFVLCCRAIYRAQYLKAEVIAYFGKNYDTDLTVNDRLEFLNFWYLLIIFNDVLIIIGSTLKEEIEKKELTGEAWNICSLLLGIGNLFVWFGVLRYLGFFRTYNVLILTLSRATPNVLRFLLCALLLYAGFVFCGWLILGPYHVKFSTLSTTSECLFALINGDDMFATFAGMSGKSPLLWWFCRFYLYTFISLFIYVVLSLFIALIMDAYETIKLYYTEGFPRSALHDFVAGPREEPCRTSLLNHQDNVSITSRKTSAGGILDSFVEKICGCSSPTKETVREALEEEEPLIT